jgi:hypothetical protein
MPQEIAPEFYRDLHGRNDIIGVIREWGASRMPGCNFSHEWFCLATTTSPSQPTPCMLPCAHRPVVMDNAQWMKRYGDFAGWFSYMSRKGMM